MIITHTFISPFSNIFIKQICKVLVLRKVSANDLWSAHIRFLAILIGLCITADQMVIAKMYRTKFVYDGYPDAPTFQLL